MNELSGVLTRLVFLLLVQRSLYKQYSTAALLGILNTPFLVYFWVYIKMNMHLLLYAKDKALEHEYIVQTELRFPVSYSLPYKHFYPHLLLHKQM